jgi:hypothetical protein
MLIIRQVWDTCKGMTFRYRTTLGIPPPLEMFSEPNILIDKSLANQKRLANLLHVQSIKL